MKRLIQKISDYDGGEGSIWLYLMPLLVVWASFYVVAEIAARVQGFMMAKAFPLLESHIRMAMFEYVQGHSYGYYADHLSGTISNKISDMTSGVTRILRLI